MANRKKPDDSRIRVERHFADKRARGLTRVHVWIPDTPEHRARLKNTAAQMCSEHAEADG